MKKILLLLLLAPVFICKAQSTNGDIDIIILEQANKMGDAFVSGNYEEFASYSHPTVVLMMGGKEHMVSEIERSFGLLTEDGITFTDASYGEPSEIILYEGQMQCTLQQMIEMETPNGNVTANSMLIAVSMDNGDNWYFIDPTGNDITTMRKVIPTLSPMLDIPVKMEPSYEEVETEED